MSDRPVIAFIEGIEDQERLDAPASLLGDAAERLTSHRGVREALTGEAAGSPVHPAVVHLPIGASVSALIIDLVQGHRGADAARLLTGLTVLSAIPSALTGVADYASKYGAGVRRAGAAHAVVNALGTTLAAASWLARSGGSGLVARALLVGAVSAYGLGGLIGGHIVHHDQSVGPGA